MTFSKWRDNENRGDNGELIVPVRMTRRGFMVNAGVVGLGTMGVGAFLTACGQNPDSSGANANMAEIRKGGTLTFAIDGTNGTVDPAVYTTLGDWLAVDTICSGLTRFDFVNPEMQLDLASAVDTSADGLTVTFTMREGVTFHDGSFLTAQDCVRTFNRQLVDGDPALPPASSRPMRGSTARNIREVVAVDDRTFAVRLIRPDLILPARLSDISTRILSAKSIEQYGVDVGQHLIGTGPFKLAKLTPQQSITLEAFDGYWGGSPVLDRLVLQQVSDASSLNAGLQSGQVNASSFVVHSAAESLGKNPKVTVYDTPNRVNIFMMMNVTKGVLSDLNVRKAVNMCIDRSQIVKNAFSGFGEEPTGYTLSPTDIGYNSDLASISKRDLEAAKALVAAAGATGKEVGFIAQNNNWYPRAAQIVEENLKAIGLVPKVELLDPGAFSSRFFDIGNHELAMWERNGYIPDPDDKTGTMLGSASSYANRATGHATLDPAVMAEIDDLLYQARQTTDVSVRTDLYTRAQTLFADKFMAIAMIAYTRNIVASNGAAEIGAEPLGSQRAQLATAALTA
ncbi:ABC transporter substrate-binding protein [Rhodococcus sp. IEGM 1379]|uniref:ABC transporter substrate-binding protein n=1 Tax=Rhodococcus sp. IEGM 1379 TaxID=3047086 RepID=UPI0024B7C70E|nr:ABC transporter substrate-binding protein [Rhodococcus sp. IEGM 1379]MDI9913992.1 ABC transporter substrate-binding protein [Rhodococcus sp. IEGM 1379]